MEQDQYDLRRKRAAQLDAKAAKKLIAVARCYDETVMNAFLQTDWGTTVVAFDRKNTLNLSSAKLKASLAINKAIAANLQADIQELRVFLATLASSNPSTPSIPANPHAFLMTGAKLHIKECGIANEASADELLSAVLKQLNEEDSRRKPFDRHKVAMWLRMIYFVALHMENTFQERAADFSNVEFQVKFKQDQDWQLLAPTPRLHVYQPSSSPFTSHEVQKFSPVPAWRLAFEHWLNSLRGVNGETLTLPTWLASMVLSSVIMGGLLSLARLKTFMALLCDENKPIPHLALCQAPYVTFRFPQSQGEQVQRWLLDPVTELLLHRRPKGSIATPSLKDCHIAILAILEPGLKRLRSKPSQSHHAAPSSMTELVRSAQAFWYTQASPIDLKIMERKVITQSLSEKTLHHWFESPVDHDHTKHGQPPKVHNLEDDPNVQTSGQSSHSRALDDQCIDFPWISKLNDLLENSTPEHALTELAKLRRHATVLPAQRVYLDWIESLLQRSKGNTRRFKLATIHRYARVLIPELVMHFTHLDLKAMTLDELTACYTDILEEAPYFIPQYVRDLRTGLHDFHRFIRKKFAKSSSWQTPRIFHEDALLEIVDCNPISTEDFLKARARLVRPSASRIEVNRMELAWIVMTLAFRLGLRRQEIFGLEVRDIACFEHLELLIRPNSHRRLKTKNSKRILYAELFLTPDECKVFRAWLKRCEHRDPQSLVFDLPNGESWIPNSSEQTSERIIKALSDTVGRKAKLHQLRHSFACWTYLALRVEEYPEILTLFEHLPQTHQILSAGSSLKKALFGQALTSSRKYAYAIASLMGHGSVVVSQYSYIHINDFIYHGLGHRAAQTLKTQTLISLGGLPTSSSYRRFNAESRARFLMDMLRAARESSKASTSNATVLIGHKHKSRQQTKPAVVTYRRDLPSATTTKLNLEAEVMACQDFLYQQALESLTPETHYKTGGNQTKEQADRWMKQALAITAELKLKTFKSSNDKKLQFYLPSIPQKADPKLWGNELLRRLDAAMKFNPSLTLEGAKMFHLRFNASKSDVVFKRETDRESFITFMKWLRLLEIPDSQIEFVVRKDRIPSGRQPIDETWLPLWSEPLIPFKPSKVTAVAPPVRQFAASYADWLGVRLLDAKGNSWPAVTQALTYLCMVVATFK